MYSSVVFCFLAFDFCRFCVVIRFFHPRNNGQWPPTWKDFYTRSCPLHYFLILILEKEPVFPFSMLSAKQGNYWYHFYNVFGMTRSLTGDWTRDSRTLSQHCTTKLSRRRYLFLCIYTIYKQNCKLQKGRCHKVLTLS